jgi:hypothetical protein
MLRMRGQSTNHKQGSNLPYGESVFGGYNTLADGIDAWGLERINYNWNDPGFSESTGHFTQLVWKATTQVGCSRIYAVSPVPLPPSSSLLEESS